MAHAINIEYTVTHRILNRPIFERSFFGHFLCPVFEGKKQDLAAILLKPFENQTFCVRFSNGEN
jgi:hypothetical protein